MENTEATVNASYHFQSRLKGEVDIEIFNDFYIRVKERPLKKTRQFKMEVATLNPQAKKKNDLALHWFAAAAISGIGSCFFIYTLFTGNELWMSLLGALIAAASSAAFTVLYFYNSERKWIVETRNSLYPLVVVPYHKRQQKEVQAFIETLQQAIENNVASKRYNSEDLFAGELRMLRRLTNNKILSSTRYDKAKAHMMKSHGTATAA
ncbi:MAG: hypothetical protein ABFS08_08945 [Pseudomonadota bacterium]